MYTLKEWWDLTIGCDPYDGWDGKMLCTENDLAMTLKANVTQGFTACYSFTLVTRGRLRLHYNDRELEIHQGDFYIYSPGLTITILDGSADYQSLCLMVDEFTSLESSVVRDMVSLAFMPIVRLSAPVVSLQPEQALLFERRMREMIAYQHSDNTYKDKLLRMLFAVFMVELQNVLEQSAHHHYVSPRAEEIFIGFNRLLPEFFLEHRDIGFYADRLCVTGDYLSRIVKRVSGRTVGDYINQMLMLEACYLLHTSSLSISQISSRLRFSEAAAFTRFFIRMKGMTPKEFRRNSLQI